MNNYRFKILIFQLTIDTDYFLMTQVLGLKIIQNQEVMFLNW